jgi:hypothetical protein
MEQRYVKLEGSTARPKKKTVPAQDQTIKLAIRLNENVNDPLRSMIRYRGDLSNMAVEALTAVDMSRVALVSMEEKMDRDTTISKTRGLHKKLNKIADDRGTSMNILVNTGLAHWLASKGALKLR